MKNTGVNIPDKINLRCVAHIPDEMSSLVGSICSSPFFYSFKFSTFAQIIIGK